MRQDSIRNRRDQELALAKATHRARLVTGPMVVLLVASGTVAAISGCDRTAHHEPASSSTADSDVAGFESTDATTADAASASTTDAGGQPGGETAGQDTVGDGNDRPSGPETLQGRWQRTDGDYVLEIVSIEDNGDTLAKYFNPQPIRVAKAKVQQDGDALTVFVELRDAGYPGCLYELKYFPEQDGLAGVYFQAAQQQKYEVMFVRAE